MTRVDWATLSQAGRSGSWDYDAGGNAETAVVEYLKKLAHPRECGRSQIALALDMDQRKLEKLLFRLLHDGVEVRNHNGYVLWRAAGLIEWVYRSGGNVEDVVLKHLVHEHPKWLYVRDIADAHGMNPTRVREVLHRMRKRGASVQVKDDPFGQMWRAN